MLLAGLTEEPGWIRSSFNLTYRVPWEKLIQGVRGVYPYIEDAEVQVDGDPLHFSAPEDLLAIPEASSIMIRGMSPILKAPIMLTFFNQRPFYQRRDRPSQRGIPEPPTTRSSTSRCASSWTPSRS